MGHRPQEVLSLSPQPAAAKHSGHYTNDHSAIIDGQPIELSSAMLDESTTKQANNCCRQLPVCYAITVVVVASKVSGF